MGASSLWIRVLTPVLWTIGLAILLVAAMPFLGVPESTDPRVETALEGEPLPTIEDRADGEGQLPEGPVPFALRVKGPDETLIDSLAEGYLEPLNFEALEAAGVEAQAAADLATAVLPEPESEPEVADAGGEETESATEPEERGVTFGGPNIPLTELMVGDLHPGVVRPVQRARLAAPVDGGVKTVFVAEGQAVKKGDPLYQLQDSIARAAVASAEAAAHRAARLDAAKAQIRLADESLRRIRNAARDGAASELEVEQAKAEAEQARAGLRAAEEEAEQQRRNWELEKRRLEERRGLAPFDGFVRKVLVREGDSLRAGQEVMQVVAMDQLEVELYLPLRLYGALQLKGNYELLAGIPINGPIPATLHTIDPVLDATTESIRCTFRIDNASGRLPAGFFARFLPR